MTQSASSATTTERTPFSRRILKLEHPANVAPLVHIVLRIGLLAFGLLVPAATNWYLAVPLIIGLSLLSFSITIGILHLHGHRPLFVSPLLNRVMDVLCCLPAGVTAVDMREQHVIHHHRFNDGPQDISCTAGYEHGPRAIWYWIRHHGRVKMFTLRTVFAANPSRERRKRRFQAVFDYTLFLALVGVLALVSDFPRFVLFVAIPYAVTLVCTGYFAWLTHAPARGFEDDPSKSMNNVNNILNFLTFNQGYHSVHHRYPGIHWSQIPDKLDFMRQVQPAVIVPYWMTPISAWRLVAPSRFLDAAYGEQWKAKLEKRLENGSVRARYLPWFAWI